MKINSFVRLLKLVRKSFVGIVYIYDFIFRPVICEFLFILGLWYPITKRHAVNAARFVAVNSRFWGGAPTDRKKILIEGHLAEYGPNYMFRTGLAAKAIQSISGDDAVVIVNGFSFQWQIAFDCYSSFGITNWIYLGRRFLLVAPFVALVSGVRAVVTFIRVRTPRQILDLYYGNIPVGDLIYDQILRTSKLPTIVGKNWIVYVVIMRGWYYYYIYTLLFFFGRYSYYIATHTSYPEYGMLCRVALRNHVTVIETTDIQMAVYSDLGGNGLPTYHNGINSEVRAALKAVDVDAVVRMEKCARESLERRLSSEVKQIDAQKAYSGKIYTREMLSNLFGLDDNDKIGFVAAHVFADSPHLSSLLFNDYYCWLVESLDYCLESRNIHWVIKPHPARSLYGEDGVVEALVRNKEAANIHMCPPDLNTSSLRNCADVILTVHGTVGLEYACFGIPVILAGKPFYAGFGFTHEPESIACYRDMVKSAASIKRLKPAQISMALQVFAVWEQQFDWSNPIITSDVLAHVWGNGVPPDLEKAYDVIVENLRNNNPQDLKLWHFARSVPAKKVIKYNAK